MTSEGPAAIETAAPKRGRSRKVDWAVIIGLAMRWMRIPAHRAISRSAGFAACRSTAACRRIAIMRSSFSSVALKDTSLTRLMISRALRGVPGRSTGLTCTSTVSLDEHSRTSGVMVGLPAKPPSQYGSPSISIAWCSVGRQPEASSTSGVNSAFRNTRPRPVRTLVAVMNSRIGDWTTRPKSIDSARISRSGLAPPGLRSYGE